MPDPAPFDHSRAARRLSHSGRHPANLAVFAQYIPPLGTVEDDVVACFREGGGVPYARFDRFHEVMAEDSGQTVLPVLKSHILPLVSRLRPFFWDDLIRNLPLSLRLKRGWVAAFRLPCGSRKAMVVRCSGIPRLVFLSYAWPAHGASFLAVARDFVFFDILES